jgi:protein-disulfide isomerase
MEKEKSSKKGFEVVMGPFQLILVIGLIIGAFYLGTLKAKVDLMEKGIVANQVGNQVADQGAQPQVPLTADNVPKPTADDWIRGDKNADVVLIEYSDLECPFCKQFHPTAKQLVEDYDGKVAWIFRHYPLAFHANAQKEAEAAQCAGELGGNEKFWEFTDTVFERTTATGTGFSLDNLVPLAKELGLNESQFKDCLDSGRMADVVKQTMEGGTKAGVNGTPGNVLLNVKTGETRLIPGAVPIDQLKTEVDAMLNG